METRFATNPDELRVSPGDASAVIIHTRHSTRNHAIAGDLFQVERPKSNLQSHPFHVDNERTDWLTLDVRLWTLGLWAYASRT